MGNNSAHAVVLPTQLCFSLRNSPPAKFLFTSVPFVSHPWSIQGGRHARFSCHLHEPSLTAFSLATYSFGVDVSYPLGCVIFPSSAMREHACPPTTGPPHSMGAGFKGTC